MISFRMTLSDLEWLSEIFSEKKHRAVYLRQLNFFYNMNAYFYLPYQYLQYSVEMLTVYSTWRNNVICILTTWMTTETPANLCTICISLKSIRKAIISPMVVWVYNIWKTGLLRSFKIIRGHRKPLLICYDFLCSLIPVLYRFRDITIYWSKVCFYLQFLLYSVSFEAIARDVPLWPRVRNLAQ